MTRITIQESQKFMAIIKFMSHVNHERIRNTIKELDLTETTASKGNVKVCTFDSNLLDFCSMKEKLESIKYSELFTLIDMGLAPEFGLISVAELPVTHDNPWSILQWLETEISSLAAEIGWILEERSLAFCGEKSITTNGKKYFKTSTEDNIPKNEILGKRAVPDYTDRQISKLLTIAGNNYKLIISSVSPESNAWKIALQNAESGGKIPHGFKLKLLDENGDNFPDNEAEAMKEAETEIYLKVQLEAGEGLIWEVEPTPDEYQSQIMYF